MTHHTLILKAGTKVNLLALTDHVEGTSRQDSIVNLIVENGTLTPQPSPQDLLPRVQVYVLPDRFPQQSTPGTVSICVETGNVLWNWNAYGNVTLHFDRADLNRRPVAIP